MRRILLANVEFKDNRPKIVTVLVDFTIQNHGLKSFSDVRAITASTEYISGYMHIEEHHEFNMDLLQEIARFGREVYDVDKLFPKWRSKIKQS